MRVEHEYERAGGRAVPGSLGCPLCCRLGPLRTEDRGRPAFGRLVHDLMNQGAVPLCGMPRVLDPGQRLISDRGDRAAEELQARHPRIVIVHTPTYASWLNQVEIYFSIIQRKVLTPNDYSSLEQLEQCFACLRHTLLRTG